MNEETEQFVNFMFGAIADGSYLQGRVVVVDEDDRPAHTTAATPATVGGVSLSTNKLAALTDTAAGDGHWTGGGGGMLDMD